MRRTFQGAPMRRLLQFSSYTTSDSNSLRERPVDEDAFRRSGGPGGGRDEPGATNLEAEAAYSLDTQPGLLTPYTGVAKSGDAETRRGHGGGPQGGPRRTSGRRETRRRPPAARFEAVAGRTRGKRRPFLMQTEPLPVALRYIWTASRPSLHRTRIPKNIE